MNTLILITSALCFTMSALAADTTEAIDGPSATESHFTLSESTITSIADDDVDGEPAPTPLGTSGYELTWYTIDGGGGTSAAGGFTLSGTIGQSDAGTMTGGGYELAGGYWTGGPGGDPVPTCTGDLNNDGAVDVSDMLIMLGNWGSCPAPCAADLNNDGNVDVSDLLILLGAWGQCP